jgi:U6 snRNA-associated Sm-like protein LSm7
MDKGISVKFNGGREITGTLKGYDQLMNLVLDDVKEVIADTEATDDAPAQPQTRDLGLIVARGTLLVSVAPVEGKSEIDNPF